MLYLDRVVCLLSKSPPDEELLTRARDRLQALLRESNLYSAQFLLGETCLHTSILSLCCVNLHGCRFKATLRLSNCSYIYTVAYKTPGEVVYHALLLRLGKMENYEQLLLERATLHGKLEEHDKALHILVHKLRDFSSAEAFCLWASSCRDSGYRQRLFHMLLREYLDGPPCGKGGSGDLAMAAVDLLNRHGEVFDAVRVLRMLPDDWSMQLLRPFLGRALRASMHASRTSQITVGLAHSENLQLLHDRVRNAYVNACK